MRTLRRVWNRTVGVITGQRHDAELAAEIQSHLDMQSEENVRLGMSPQEARRAAVLTFGSVEETKESYRDQRGWPLLDAVKRDVRFAVRSFLRRPAFTAIAILSLGLGIGSATAVFSVVDRILFRSLPYANADRLVSIGIVAPLISLQDWLFAGTYHEWREAKTPFEATTSWVGVSDCDLTGETPIRLGCARVESTFLPVLGIQPVLGRNFTAEEDKLGAAPVALISSGLWQSRFASERGIIGRTLTLDGVPATIVGVLPRSFELPTLATADIVMPQMLPPGSQRQRLVTVIGRLPDEVSSQAAAAQLEPLFQRFVASAPPNFRKILKLRVRSLQDHQTSDYQVASWTLLGAVLAVLLIACANVANLLLTLAATRRQELGVRAALGAARARLVAQQLTEALLLGLAGGLVGCALAWALLKFFSSVSPEGLIRLQEANLDWRVLCFSLAISILSGLGIGLASSLASPGVQPQSGWRVVGNAKTYLKPLFIAGQVAAAVILLTGAGMLLASLRNMQNTPLGMSTGQVITASLTLGKQRYADDRQQIAFFEQLEQRLSELPGSVAAAVTDSLPPGGDPRAQPFASFKNPGGSIESGLSGLVYWRYVTPGYFTALGIPILRGRAFTAEDQHSGAQPIVLNQTLAAKLYPHQNPVGKVVGSHTIAAPMLIIGVAEDVRNNGFAQQPQPEFYVIRKHQPGGAYDNQRPPYGWRRATIIVRSSLNEQTTADLIRAEIRKLDPTLPVDISTLEQHVGTLLQRPRLLGSVLSLFAAIGLLLAAVGLYGVVSFLVSQRTREIGIRMALGATAARIVRITLSQTMAWVGIGAIGGVLGSLALSRSIRALLFQVPERSPLLLAVSVAMLASVALLAAWLPARRAVRINPVQALRHE